MARSSRRRRLPRRRRRRRGRFGRACAALGLIAVGLPLLILLALRVVPPPTTAFMVRYELRAAAGPPLAADWVDWERIAPEAALAVIAAEDQKFLDHRGFDVDALRDALQTAWRGGPLRGASTISQQVSKNLFLWPGRSLVRKALEAGLTAGMEGLWSKRRILEVYLNVAEFGTGVFGVGAASERFFAKAPAALTEAEAALLAAVLPNPSGLHVARPSPYVRARQSWIRAQMANLRAAGVLHRLAAEAN